MANRASPPPLTARRLKALNGSTPHQYICNLYDSEENHRFHLNPYHHFAGPNTYPVDFGGATSKISDHCRSLVNICA